MSERKTPSLLVLMLALMAGALMACNGGNGGDDDADTDAGADPSDDTSADSTGDPSDDPSDEPGEDAEEDPGEDPAGDPAGDPGEDPAGDPGEDPAEDPGEDPSEDPAEEEEMPPELTLELYCEGRIRPLCTYIESCCTEDEADIFGDLDCEDYTANEAYTDCMDDYGTSIEEGRLQLNPAGLADCMAARTALLETCLDYTLFMAGLDALDNGACAALLEGLVETDGDCSMSEECADGRCREDVCEPYTELGNDCRRNSQCGPGNTCLGEVCAALSAEDGDCDGGDDEDCLAGLMCDRGTCVPLLEAGEECNRGECEGVCDTDPRPPVCIDVCDGL
ncbi:MAG: hypothetical protein ABIJ56_11610 [Pseudomonadota bacterium]